MASGSGDKKIIIWQKINETTFNLSETLIGHTNRVLSLVVLPNNMFASLSLDSSIRIWNETTLQLVTVLNDHKAGVNGLVVLKNEKLISISDDNTFIVWNISLNVFSKISTFETSTGNNLIELFSNDTLITVDSKNSLQIWSTTSSSFEKKISFKAHNDTVSDLTFLKNGFLASTSFDKTIKIWDNTFQLWASVSNAHSKDVLALKEINESVLISSSLDGTINFWITDHFTLNKTFYVN